MRLPVILLSLFATLPALRAAVVMYPEYEIDPVLAIVGTGPVGTTPLPPAQGGNYAGVGAIFIGGVQGTGTLINETTILTAAHVAAAFSGSGTINFNTPSGSFSRTITAKTVHPLWTSNPGGNLNYDVAYLTIGTPITTITPYELYLNTDEIGKAVEFVGYGRTNNSGTGIKRKGVNEVDFPYTFTYPNIFTPTPTGNILISDFDNDGTDYLIWSGDSGGPMFIGGKVAGIASWISSASPTYGNVAGHVRVSSFLNDFLSPFVPVVVASSVPEPTTAAYAMIALLGLRHLRARRFTAEDRAGTAAPRRIRRRRLGRTF